MFGRKKGKPRGKSGKTKAGAGAHPAAAPSGGPSTGGVSGAPAGGPERIGRYAIVETIGEGGMGRVYRGHDPVIGRSVAIKVVSVRPDLGDEDARQYRERFLREAQAAGALVHPHIVAVYDVGQDRATGSPYIVMEHVAGSDLKKVIRSFAPVPAKDAIRIVTQIALALDFAHRRGIVHRDIKPANVLISERGQVKITDFGVARLPGSDLTRSDQFVGSPGFMSPEQLRGTAVDGRADLFALGVILYELLTGRSPFDGENVSEVLYRITTQPADAPSDVCPDVSADFDPILEKALSKDPGARFQTGQEMIAALRSLSVDGVNPAAQAAAATDPAAAAVDAGGAGETAGPDEARGWDGTSGPHEASGSSDPAGRAADGEATAGAGGRGDDGAEESGTGEAGRPGAPAGGDAVSDLPRHRPPHPAGLSPWWSLDSQWRLGALMTLLLVILVGLNWAFLYLVRGPLGRAALAEEARAASQGSPGGAAPLALAVPGARPAAAPGRGGAHPGSDPRTRSAGPAVCAMTYADPEQIARVLAARPSLASAARAAALPRPAQLRLELKHRLDGGRLIVLIDGKTVLSRPVEGGRGGRSSETHVLSIPAGEHAVEVRLVGGKGALEAKSKITGTMEHDRIAVLQADHRAARRKGGSPELTLAWSETR